MLLLGQEPLHVKVLASRRQRPRVPLLHRLQRLPNPQWSVPLPLHLQNLLLPLPVLLHPCRPLCLLLHLHLRRHLCRHQHQHQHPLSCLHLPLAPLAGLRGALPLKQRLSLLQGRFLLLRVPLSLALCRRR